MENNNNNEIFLNSLKTNIKECVIYLEENKIPYKIISNEIIEIYKKINISEFVITLSKKDCIIKDVIEKDESLENYYLNLIGGVKDV